MTYSVLRDDGVRVEGLTREQVYELIYGTTGKVATGVDEAFITKIKEQNKGGSAKVWIGSNAEYNAIEVKDGSTIYVVTDDPYFAELEAEIQNLGQQINEAFTVYKAYVDRAKEVTDEKINSHMSEVKEWMTYIEGELAT